MRELDQGGVIREAQSAMWWATILAEETPLGTGPTMPWDDKDVDAAVIFDDPYPPVLMT